MMFPRIHGSFLRAFVIHVVTICPWLLGLFFALSPLVFLIAGWLVTGSVLLVLVSLQYILPIPKWPAFAAWLQHMDPRGYYNKCELAQHNLQDLRKEKSLLCYHPHGILCVGFSWNGAHSPELGGGSGRGIVWLIVDILCEAPIFGLVLRWCGNLQGAGPKNMRKLMEQGSNIGLIPGGFEEATMQRDGVEMCAVKKKKGFIKYALRYGYRVHPVYTFGECDTYWTFPYFPSWFTRTLNSYKLPCVVFRGSWWVPIFPRTNIELWTVVGEGIQFPKLVGDELSVKAVEEWHAKYVSALEALFEKYKAEAGKPHAELTVL